MLGVLIVLPATYVFSGTDGMTSGPGLLFISLTEIFDAMGGIGAIIGMFFSLQHSLPH